MKKRSSAWWNLACRLSGVISFLSVGKLLFSIKKKTFFAIICQFVFPFPHSDPSLPVTKLKAVQLQEMLTSIVLQSTITLTSSFESPADTHLRRRRSGQSSIVPALPKSFLPGFGGGGGGGAILSRFLYSGRRRHWSKNFSAVTTAVNASLIEAPLIWAGRLCVFYALLKAGLAGSEANPLVSGLLDSAL